MSTSPARSASWRPGEPSSLPCCAATASTRSSPRSTARPTARGWRRDPERRYRREAHASGGRPSSFAVQAHRGEAQAEQAPVPPSADRPLLTPGIGVIVELRADIGRRLLWKRIVLQQRRHAGLVLQQPFDETREPLKALRVVERGEPHLPVQAWLIGDAPARAARDVA